MLFDTAAILPHHKAYFRAEKTVQLPGFRRSPMVLPTGKLCESGLGIPALIESDYDKYMSAVQYGFAFLRKLSAHIATRRTPELGICSDLTRPEIISPSPRWPGNVGRVHRKNTPPHFLKMSGVLHLSQNRASRRGLQRPVLQAVCTPRGLLLWHFVVKSA